MDGKSYMNNNEILQPITGEKSTAKNNIFLACDNIFYHRFAINCAKTILHFSPYLHIHIHVVNHSGELFTDKNVTYTFEQFPSLPEHPSTRFYASVRLVRAAELFEDWQHVMIIDVDSLEMLAIPEDEFVKQSSKLSQLVRKGGRWNNSMICLGLGEEARKFKESIKDELLSRPIPEWDGWYDQFCMDEIRSQHHIQPIELSWLNFSVNKQKSYFYSGKGERKESEEFENVTQHIMGIVNK
jgi:hypothetical protein